MRHSFDSVRFLLVPTSVSMMIAVTCAKMREGLLLFSFCLSSLLARTVMLMMLVLALS